MHVLMSVKMANTISHLPVALAASPSEGVLEDTISALVLRLPFLA
jgi:hypothetical protein